MATISISKSVGWAISGHAYRTIFDDALGCLDFDDHDRPELERAYITREIALDFIEPDQARRIAHMLAEAAGRWRRRLLATPSDDPRYEYDIPFAETTLAEIEAGLTEFASGAVPP